MMSNERVGGEEGEDILKNAYGRHLLRDKKRGMN